MTAYVFSVIPSWNCDDLTLASDLVSAGGVLVVPTDTVYGIGARADDPEAVLNVLAAKGRGRHMPPPVLVHHPDDIEKICIIPRSAAETVAALTGTFWPGALTVILPARPDLGWDLGETGGTVALRMPDHPAMLTLLEKTGPMAVTSANKTGQPPATTVAQAQEAFGDSIAGYVDAGPTHSSTPSTILDLAHGGVAAIRVGALSLSQLSEVIGCDVRSV
ncbi:L-threonylcarbamoyladenylate synthase [Schaalia sp. ZJ1691]|uniref:L-threonylcarbamoyladenylate synthase n=1 Tax=Schaalia sp. ZJ1691 TaxID=2709404 RepID=UPI0013EE18AE